MGSEYFTFLFYRNLHEVYCALHAKKDSDKDKIVFKELKIFSLEKRRCRMKENVPKDRCMNDD